MDISDAHYIQCLRIALLEKKGSEFQDLFVKLATHAYGSDFEAVRSYGNQGDWKCDGRRVSTGTIFQCYAPEVSTEAKIISKINKDLAGAQKKWSSFMKVWAFVHNDSRGLPPAVNDHVDKKRSENPNLEIEVWNESKLLELFMRLSTEAKVMLFGEAPSRSTVESLVLEDLKPVIDALGQQDPDPIGEISSPSVEKLDKNALSCEAKEILRIGRLKVRLVETYFQKAGLAELGEKIAEAFRKRYAELKALGLDAEHIFGHLQKYAGCSEGTPKQQAAGVAVLAYFFDSCDIFENPDEGESDS